MKKLYSLMLLLPFAATLMAQPCTKPFFSEYVEGSGNNKALEIYNPSSATINLAGYKVVQYNNGGDTVRYTFNLTGSIAPNDVYVIVNSQAAASLKAFGDTVTGNSVMGFNGNDVLALLNGTDTLDRIGHITDTLDIPFDTSTGKDHSYVRLPNVQEGTANWAVGQLQWITLPRDTAYLGWHISTCGTVTDTLVSFNPNSGSVSESAGTYNISLQLNAPLHPLPFSVNVELVGGTGSAADINNYTTQTVTFNANQGTQNITITITDDAIQEPAETLIFKLTGNTGNLLIGADSVFTLTIGASDVAPVVVNLAAITALDTAGRPDSLGVKVKVTGTVYGINYRSTGAQFFIHDATDGLQVISTSNSFGYTVAEGDSVAIEGEVGFFNGMTEIDIPDTIYKIGTHTLLAPRLVQDLDESTESELVRINNVHLVTPSQWDTTGHSTGFNADITDGNNTWTLRIDEQTNIFKTNMAAPAGNFHVIGMGAQFDASAPYNSGYQLMPRTMQDIILVNGIEETAVTGIKVYPNPNNGNFTVQLSNAGINSIIRLYNVTGEVVYNNQNANEVDQITLGSVGAGLYILEVERQGTIYRNKVLVK